MTERPILTGWLPYDVPKPRPLQKKLTKAVRREFAENGERDWDRETDLAMQIYDQHLRKPSFHTAFQEYLNVYYRFSELLHPLEVKGNTTGKDKMSILGANLSELLAIDHAENVPDAYGAMLMSLEDRFTSGSNFEKWFVPKITMLRVKIDKWKENYAFIEDLQSRLHGYLENIDQKDLESHSTQLWRKVLGDQGYGIKLPFSLLPYFCQRISHL